MPFLQNTVSLHFLINLMHPLKKKNSINHMVVLSPFCTTAYLGPFIYQSVSSLDDRDSTVVQLQTAEVLVMWL